MARAQVTDYYQNFRFWVSEPNAFLDPSAGFKTVSIPKLTTDVAEYREGTRQYTLKQAGIPKVDEVTMTQGIARKASNFFNWVQLSIGPGEYRTDLEIRHFHRVDPQGITGAPSKVYRLLECFASEVEISSGLDADSNEISIASLIVNFEELAIIDNFAANA